MKVLQINSVCGTGSTGRIATGIDRVLKEQGHTSYVAYGRGTARDCHTAIRIGTKVDNYLHAIRARLFDADGYGSKVPTREFIRTVRQIDPDLIHLHNIHGYFINMEVLFEYLREVDKPVVWTLHDCWSMTGHCVYFDHAGCYKWKQECHDCPQKCAYPASILMDGSKRNFRVKRRLFTQVNRMTLVTPSRWLADLVSQSFLKEYPTKVINNGIDLRAFTFSPSSFRQKHDLEGKFVILGVASIWTTRKGLDFFLRLSEQMDGDIAIVLVGVTEAQRRALPKKAIGILRTESIRELAEIYSAADVFVNPTLEDNFPTTNLEALACGTPVVTFATGGSPESVTSECGAVVKKGDLRGLIESLNEIRTRTKASYFDKAIEHAAQYDREKRFREYAELYSQMLSSLPQDR